MSEYLSTPEEAYGRFEAQHCRGARFWRAPACMLQETTFYALFEEFVRQFPDHPSDKNTVFYLVEPLRVSPTVFSVLMCCDHFEHTSLEDLRKLTSFIASAAASLSEFPEMAGIETLDGVQERLTLSFHEPRPTVVELLQNRGTEGAA